MKRTLTISMLLLSVLGLVVLPGCKTDEPGVTNRLGSYRVTMEAPPTEVADAAQEALEDLGLKRITAEATEVDMAVVGYTAQNDKATISGTRVGEASTDVSVRVGTFGDEDLSSTILRRIEENLQGQGQPREVQPRAVEPTSPR